MSADGVWNITVTSPLGPQVSSLTLKTDGGALTGSQSAMGDTKPIRDGKIEGDTVTWSNSVSSPFPMDLDFTGKVDGDTLNGSVKAGGFGSFPFAGKRA